MKTRTKIETHSRNRESPAQFENSAELAEASPLATAELDTSKSSCAGPNVDEAVIFLFILVASTNVYLAPRL